MRRSTTGGPSRSSPYSSRDSSRSIRRQVYAMGPGRIDAQTGQAIMTVMNGTTAQGGVNQPSFEPSMTLRAAIVERLEAQKEALEEVIEELERLITIAEAGAADGIQSPGDQQISGADLAGIREYSRAANVVNNHHDAINSRQQSSRMSGMSPRIGMRPLAAARMPDSNVQQENSISQYQQLERQIEALVERSTTQQSRVNHYQAMAEQYAALADPRGAQRDRLERLLGPANGMDSGRYYGQRSVSPSQSTMTQSSPYMSQQQPFQGDPTAQVKNVNETGQTYSIRSGGMGRP